MNHNSSDLAKLLKQMVEQITSVSRFQLGLFQLLVAALPDLPDALKDSLQQNAEALRQQTESLAEFANSKLPLQ